MLFCSDALTKNSISSLLKSTVVAHITLARLKSDSSELSLKREH